MNSILVGPEGLQAPGTGGGYQAPPPADLARMRLTGAVVVVSGPGRMKRMSQDDGGCPLWDHGYKRPGRWVKPGMSHAYLPDEAGRMVCTTMETGGPAYLDDDSLLPYAPEAPLCVECVEATGLADKLRDDQEGWVG